MISNANGGVLANNSYLADGTKAEALLADGTGLSNPIYKPFEFNGYFEGTHFVSARGGTLYQGMKKEASSLTITSMPNKLRQIRGWIGAPRWEVSLR